MGWVDRYSEGMGDRYRNSEMGWVDRCSDGHTYLLQSSVSQHVDQRVDVGLTREVQPGPDVSVWRDHTL